MGQIFSAQPGTCVSPPSNSTTTVLSRLESVGLTLDAEAGFISLVSLLFLFSLIVRNIIRYSRYAHGKWSLIREPADAYVLSLFFADLLQAIGACMDVRWIHTGIVEHDGFCTAQGVIQQLGETAVAMATTVIALHTFVVVWIRKGAHNLWLAYAVIAFTWLAVILFVSIAAGTNSNYDAPTPFWCWIGAQHPKLRFAGEYFWLWLGLLVSIFVYLPLFLWSRGYISVDNERWWVVSIDRRASKEKDEDMTIRVRPNAPSLALLSYPVAYSIVILPVSIVRWKTFSGGCVPDAATFFSVFLHDMFGFTNVVLLLTTKPTLLLFEDPRRSRRTYDERGRAPEVEDTPSCSRTQSQLLEGSGIELRPSAGNMGALHDEDEEEQLGVSNAARR